MRKLAIAVALSTTVLAGPALARDGAWYVGGDFGPMLVEDMDNVFTPGNTAGSPGDVQIGFDEGFDGSGFVGYDFGAFRIEAEVSYKSADVEEVIVNSLIVPGSGGTSNIFRQGNGDVSILSGMVNGLLEFGDEDGLTGFVGGGVGMARVDVNGVSAFTNSAPILDDSDTRFAWQVLAGVRTALTPNIDLHLKYRFFNVDDLEMVGFGGRAVDTDLRSHSLLGGITFNFGAPRIEEPPCLAPNALDANGVCQPPVDTGPPPCPEGTFRNPNGVCEAPPERFRECPGDVRVPESQQCPVVPIAPAIVFFDWDRSDLTDQARNTLNGVAENYRRGGQTQVVLAGHADRSGSDAYNVGLSQRRANAVRDYLVSQGIPAGSMTTQAFGEERPRVETADGVREPDNRRVEITFGPGSGW
jgi:outer membrane protein OmpA-like peptidoglycan-associated protein/opacity protein-like surface antigen